MNSPTRVDRKPSRRNAFVGVLLLLVVACAAWWFFRGHEAPAPKKPARGEGGGPVQVTTAPATPRDVPLYRAGIGTVTATQSVTVKPRIDGQLDQVGFIEGQDVKAGQMIARIDPRTLQAQLAQVQAQKARDQAQLANARVDLQRYTALLAEDAATRQQLDTQKALVAQLEAAVATDQAQIAYAQVQLGFTTITAPISGRVGARLVDPGNIVHASDTGGLVVINQIDPISVVFTLPEDAFQDVNRALRASREPLAAEAYSRDGSQRLGTGRLVLLNNQIDPTTGTVQLKASFVNVGHMLWPGQFVNVRLVLGKRAQALTIPAAAVQRNQEGTYVFVAGDDGHARIQPITVAQIEDGVAVIDKGLAAGERVVTDGHYKVKPGGRVVEAGRGGKAGAPPGGASGAAAAASAGASTGGSADASAAGASGGSAGTGGGVRAALAGDAK